MGEIVRFTLSEASSIASPSASEPPKNASSQGRSVRKSFKNYALKSMNEVRAKLKRAILYIERNPKIVRSITSFPYIVNSI